MRVLIVENDEHGSLRSEHALRQRMGDDISICRVTSLSRALRRCRTQPIDVVLLQLATHDSPRLETLESIRSESPETAVVVYTTETDDALAMRALRLGAQECIAMTEVPAEGLARVLQFAIERQRRVAQLDAARNEAAHRATHDPLTGLPNRELFLDQLNRALAYGARYGRKTGVLFVDLDGFKGINDVHGHTRGDAMLREVSRRLLECVRRSDAVARLGGDEFVVLLPEVTSRRDVAHVRETILECLRDPIDIGGGQIVTVDASVGGAMSPLDGVSVHDLLNAADADMYRDKTQRRRGRVSTPSIGARAILDAVSDLQDLSKPEASQCREARMRTAMRGREFEVHYQPIIDVQSDRLVGAEALLRWRDPERGLLLPCSFLSLAEDTGLIVPIGEWVLREACRNVLCWRARPGASSIRVSVNVSAVQLRERGFADRVASILRDTGCPPDALVLELTENSMITDGEVAIESLRQLKALGVRLFVDDFGMGFASLTFVREAPVDGIKLDRRFVTTMLRDGRDHAIVASLLRLAHGLKLDVIAEGVESTQHAQRLAHLQCFVQQGRHFSDALTASALEARLAERAGWFSGPVRAAKPKHERRWEQRVEV